ncbi:ATP-dependent helicase [Candidatus Manganitrophus noduliformans]|uniref:DNA 3'-5' helicase n=1 Tax=Candidatus Manganitrophus noduliformans TaxID=2606439 RepID=A0A7X6DT44_9BACT|nr:UvrD-helicase domain-containing protein [Candidatus Manganitrophus noduliformans]NKE72869.1 AAA family ATPase [Candidatus Manganitrophus noduliformans]
MKNEAKIFSGAPSEEGTAISEILSGLNAPQREVALHGEGPLLVLAVAGSGKTRAIAHRAACLVKERDVSPSQILCLTFTNKAAGEMRERIGKLLGGPPTGLTVATFHALGARLLRVHHALIERSARFSIYDEEDAARVIREAAKERGAEGTWEVFRADIGRLKNLGVLPGDNPASVWGEYDRESRDLTLLREVYSRYEEKLSRYDALDFNDLLLKALLLLERRPEVLSHLRRRCRYLLVDEYQDTCPLQERLLNLLAAPSYNLCAVGDDDQAIYTFRHADVTGILTFESRYPGARVIRMEENYRSGGKIIEVAGQVIAGNRRRQPKSIHTRNPSGLPVEAVGFPSEEEEAAWIGEKIEELKSGGIPFGEIAILCRVASLFRPLEKELARKLIPYLLVDGLAFWERREVKDIMAYLRFIHNPLDYLSFKRIANVPPRGLGKRTLQQIEVRLRDAGASLPRILEEAASPKLRPFLELIESLRSETRSVSGQIEALLDRTGYEGYLSKTCPDAERRMGRLIQLQAIAKRFEQDPEGDPSDIGSLLSEFLLEAGLSSAGQAGEGRPDQVHLMTVHAAKGLEFRGVFVIGLEEGVLPHARCRDNPEEERRLFYVAVTRAKERLFLSWSTRRNIQGREMHLSLSSFMREILSQKGGAWRMSPAYRKAEEAVIFHRPGLRQKAATS